MEAVVEATLALVRTGPDAALMSAEVLAGWPAFVLRSERPLDSTTMSCKEAAELEAVVLRFIADTRSPAQVSTNQPNFKRAWIHGRVSQLGLVSDTTDRATNRMTITRPAGWALDYARPASSMDEARDKYTAEKGPKQAKAALAAKKSWSTLCTDCAEVLDVYTAYYNVHVGGPYCMKCIDGDEELYGLKWEAKVEFWTPHPPSRSRGGMW